MCLAGVNANDVVGCLCVPGLFRVEFCEFYQVSGWIIRSFLTPRSVGNHHVYILLSGDPCSLWVVGETASAAVDCGVSVFIKFFFK